MLLLRFTFSKSASMRKVTSVEVESSILEVVVERDAYYTGELNFPFCGRPLKLSKQSLGSGSTKQKGEGGAWKCAIEPFPTYDLQVITKRRGHANAEHDHAAADREGGRTAGQQLEQRKDCREEDERGGGSPWSRQY